jgi:membrane-bound lytic murein transglycosylase D
MPLFYYLIACCVIFFSGCGASRQIIPSTEERPAGKGYQPVPSGERTAGLLRQAEERIAAAREASKATQFDLARAELDAATEILSKVEVNPSTEGALFVRYTTALKNLERAHRDISPASEPSSLEESPVIIFLRSLDDSTLDQVSGAEITQAMAIARIIKTCDVPIDYNEQTARSIRLFQTSLKDRFALWLSRTGRYLPMIHTIFSAEGLPKDLAYLAVVESGYNPNARSRANAIGMWQFIEPAARVFDLRIDRWVDERRDPVKSTRAAAKYLKRLHERLGDWRLAMASYNWGRINVEKAIDKAGTRNFWALDMPRETRDYIPLFMAATLIIKSPETFGFSGVSFESPLSYEEVILSSPVDLKIAAQCAGVSTDEIKELNPELRLEATPPDTQLYRLKVPKGSSATFQTAYAALPPERRTALYSYTIRKGDTIKKIAKRFGTTPEAILAANTLRSPKKLRVGTHIMLPFGSSGQQVATPEKRAVVLKEAVRQNAIGTVDTVFHTVRKGETLRKIAGQYETTIEHLAALNELNPRKYTIYPGDRLIARQTQRPGPPEPISSKSSEPKPPLVYTVKRGDTLWSIAKAFSVDIDQIVEWNGLHRPSRLKEGHQLKIWSAK